MPIKRYTATADNTITNAFKENLVTRATASNTGNSDILEINGFAKDLPLSFIKAIWPDNLGKGARAWTNRSLFKGIISDLGFNSKFVFKKDGEFLFIYMYN